MKKTIRKTKKFGGFSLIEIILSVSVFVFIIGGVAVFGARSMEAHMKNQAMQNSIENTRFAIESLSKKIRTSSEVIGSAGSVFGKSSWIYFIDNVDQSKYCYRFDYVNKLLEVSRIELTDASYAAAVDCGDFSVFIPLIGGSGASKIEVADGGFYVKPTDLTTAGSYDRGLVTIVIDLRYGDIANSPSQNDMIKIQSSVSVLDY